jgi:hypothetical protein
VDKAKVETVEQLPPPTDVKSLRSFLGHAGFYRRFIKDFSKITKPLTHLLQNNVAFDYDGVMRRCVPRGEARHFEKVPHGGVRWTL